jgi:hypothetical protein
MLAQDQGDRRMSGTVNISRGIWSDTAFKEEQFTEREAFMWMIMEASYKAREKRVGSVVARTERGQLATSIRFMSDAWGWSKSRVDRFLKRLENRDMIGTESGTGINVITIRKYDEYQNTPNHNGTAETVNRDSSGTAAGQQRDKPNKGLIPDATQVEKKREAKASQKSPTGTRLQPDWILPKDWGEWAISEGWDEPTIREQAERFRDYWIGVPGAKGRKLDWQATFRNWMRNKPKSSFKIINGGQYAKPTSRSEERMRAFIAGARSTS